MSKQFCKNYPDDLLSREQEYKHQGLWTGERLKDRYEKIISGRSMDLAVVDNRGNALNHGELWASSGKLADALTKQGVQKGDVVIIFLPNLVEWQVALLGIMRMGGIPANLPTRTDAESLSYVAELTGTRAIVTSDQHFLKSTT